MIPFNNLQREPEELLQAQIRAAEAVLRSGWWVLGQQVERFEKCWADYTDSSGTVGVANGMDAIEIGLRALGIGPGDEVITTSLTAFATTLAIQRCGAIPVFADIDPSTACISPEAVERCISSSTRAVLVVHLYGRACDLTSITEICKKYSLLLVEDCAQSHGCKYKGASVGSFGAFGAWSFYPTKNLGAVGDAGALSSNNKSLVNDCRKIRNYGQSDRYHHDLFGVNSRLDEIQAALLLERIHYLPEWTKKRRQIAQRYWGEICHPEITLLSPPQDPLSHVHHLFVLRTPSRARLEAFLSDCDIKTLIHYPLPSHQQKALAGHRCDPLGLQHTEAHAATCLSLPIHPFLTEDEVSAVINACNSFQ